MTPTPFPRRRGVVSLVTLTLACALSAPAHASPVFETMGATVGQGGFNARVSSPGPASVYFNPSLLPKAKQGLTTGITTFHDAIGITLFARDPAVDVPVSGLNRFGGNQPPLPTSWLENGCDPEMGGQCATPLAPNPRQGDGSSGNTRGYVNVGLVSPIFGKYLTGGVFTMIPIGPFTTGHSFFVDEREQYFTNSLHPEMYSDRLDAISLAFGFGSEPIDGLSFGLSMTLSLINQADAQTYVGNSALIGETLQLSTDLKVKLRVSPHMGVTYEPNDRLSLSATVHSPQKLQIETAFGTFLPNGDLQVASRTATHAWLPWTVGFGGQYDFYQSASQTLGTAAQLTYARWSQYLNRQNERPRRNYDWADQVTGSLGLRHSYDERLRTFFDVTYVPSPVPAQTGRDNYVDNDRVGLAGGTELEIPIERMQDVAVRIGISAQLHFLPERSQQKFDPRAPDFAGGTFSQLVVDEWEDGTVDVVSGEEIAASNGLQTNNPGWPGYSSKGVLGGATLSFTLLY